MALLAAGADNAIDGPIPNGAHFIRPNPAERRCTAVTNPKFSQVRSSTLSV